MGLLLKSPLGISPLSCSSVYLHLKVTELPLFLADSVAKYVLLTSDLVAALLQLGILLSQHGVALVLDLSDLLLDDGLPLDLRLSLGKVLGRNRDD